MDYRACVRCTGCIDATTTDEAGRLVHSLLTMQANLVNTVNAIKQSTETISIGSREIATGNSDLSAERGGKTKWKNPHGACPQERRPLIPGRFPN